MESKQSIATQSIGWGPWLRFYALLLLIFFEVVAYVFQNIEKKRLGYELSVLVGHKKEMMETMERQGNSLLQFEKLDEIAARAGLSSVALAPNRWPVVRLDQGE